MRHHLYSHRSDTSVNIAEVISPVISLGMIEWELNEVRLHLSSASTLSNSLVIAGRLEANSTSPFNTKFLTVNMSSIQDLVWMPEYSLKFRPEDRVFISWTSDKAWALEVVITG